MKLNKIFLIVLILALLETTLGAHVLAEERAVGVSPGDWFKYGDVTFEWSSDDPNATFPVEYEQWEMMEEAEWMSISIQEVSDTNITLEAAWHPTIGSDWTSGGYIDIDTGYGENSSLFVISAGLVKGDRVYTAGGYSNVYITETIVRTYPDSPRETNHLNMTMEYELGEHYFDISMNWYWDKETGILVEMLIDWKDQREEYLTTWSMMARITESSVWVVPEFPSWALIPVFIGLTTALVLYKRRLLKTPTH